MKISSKLWLGILILALLSPLGIIIPEYFKAGSAWGEWGVAEIQKLAGYIPRGLERLSSLWQAPLPDYAFKGWEGKGVGHLSFAYLISAALGIIIVVITALLLGRILSRKGR